MMFYMLTHDEGSARKIEGFSHIRKNEQDGKHKVFFRASNQFRAEKVVRTAMQRNMRVIQSSAR